MTEQHRARHAVARALKEGELVRADACSRCGKGGTIQAHHKSYAPADRLKVEWLCRGCHYATHSGPRPRRKRSGNALALAIEIVGGITATAKTLGVSRQCIYNWLAEGMNRAQAWCVFELARVSGVPHELIGAPMKAKK